MKKLKFKVGDEVITVKDHDNGGNEVFPIGTKGAITNINEKSNVPYQVTAEDGEYWYYNDEMLKAEGDEHDIDAFLIAGEVLRKTKGDEAKIREVIYYLKSFMDY